MQVNTAFNVNQIVLISRQESKLDFDVELVAESSDIERGFIKPGYTRLSFTMDKSLEPPK
jgi:hypothetical protein